MKRFFFAVLLIGTTLVLVAFLHFAITDSSLTMHPLKLLASGVLYSLASLSPSKDKVAFSDKKGLWIVKIDGSEREFLIPNDIGIVRQYSWSPDERKITLLRRWGDKGCLIEVDIERKQTLLRREFTYGKEYAYQEEGKWVIGPLPPKPPRPKYWRELKLQPDWYVSSWSPDGKVALLAERLHRLFYGYCSYHLGFWDGKQLTQIIPISLLTWGSAKEVIWYPDSQKLLVVFRREGGGISPPPGVEDSLYMVFIDGSCQSVEVKQKGLFHQIWLLDAERHIYLYLINSELWLAKLKGIRD